MKQIMKYLEQKDFRLIEKFINRKLKRFEKWVENARSEEEAQSWREWATDCKILKENFLSNKENFYLMSEAYEGGWRYENLFNEIYKKYYE